MKRLSINNKAARAVFKENNMSKVVKRSEADEKYMWNMKDMYENDGLWEDDVKEAESLMNGMPAYIKVMDESPKKLLSLLEYDTEISKKLEKIYVYANQKSHEDMGESECQDMAGRASEPYGEISDAERSCNACDYENWQKKDFRIHRG